LESLIVNNRIEAIGKGRATRYVPKIGTAESLTHFHLMLDRLQKLSN